jgi:response regulator NasT
MNSELPASPRLYLVDDDAIVLSTLGTGLSRQGYAVETFESADTALARYRAAPPDLVILDYRLPEMTGAELARAMIKEAYRPMIVLSAYSDAPTVREAVGLGVSAYLVKPVEAERLAPSIEAALARFAELEALLKQEMNLREGLEKNRIINTAIGIVMERSALPLDLAFESLRKLARDQRRPLRDVALELVDAVSTANGILQRLRD